MRFGIRSPGWAALLAVPMLIPASVFAQHGAAGTSARLTVHAQVLETRAAVGVSGTEVATGSGDTGRTLRLHLSGDAPYRVVARRAPGSGTTADSPPRLWLRLDGEDEQELEPGATRIVSRRAADALEGVAELRYRVEGGERGAEAPASLGTDVVLEVIFEPAT